jgi:hypothetical protein
MKRLVIWSVVIFVACGAGAWWLNSIWSKERGFLLGFAYGQTEFDGFELHVIVAMPMVNIEGPRLDERTAAVLWDEWVEQHFDLRDDADNSLKLVRAGSFSSLIPDEKAGNPEFFLKAEVTPGVTYTLDYKPERAVPKRYRHTFTALTEGQPLQRLYFKTVDGG